MKAIRHPDGRIEYEGSPEEIATATGVVPARAEVRNLGPTEHGYVNGTKGRAALKVRRGVRGVRHPGSIPALILDLLAKEPAKVFSPAEVADTLKIEAKAARGTMNRLAKDERPPAIKFIGRGQYQALPKEVTQ